jgi:hypothetical protein
MTDDCSWCSKPVPLAAALEEVDLVGAQHFFHAECFEDYRQWFCHSERTA